MDVITGSSFASDFDLPDWRYLLGSIEATFHAGSFAAAASFIVGCADLADQAEHHPDFDMRYPDVVHINLVTHSAGGLTTKDTDLAAQISQLAAETDATADPTTATTQEIAIDAIDIAAVRPFWQAVLDYVAYPANDPDAVVLIDPRGVGPAYWFQQMDEPRTERNNFHIDVTVCHDVAEQRVADTIAAGGRLVSDRRAKAFWILADPEGNEACICTWQDRD